MKFVVDRKTWYRGQGESGSCLFHPENGRCCLGFFANAIGHSDEEIDDVAMPDGITNPKNWPESLLTIDDGGYMYTELTGKIATVNDNSNIEDDEREEQLTELFLKADVEVVFEG